jgi:hypothetical protein
MTTPVERFEELLADRRMDARCDAELWRFMDRISQNLCGISDTSLADRWKGIAKNILYLVGRARDAEPLAAKAFSSWWWLQTLVHTEAELEKRGQPTPGAPDVTDPVALRPEFSLDQAIASRYWARMGETDHLLEMLDDGKIRFRPASSYDDPQLDPARRDRELEKVRKRPGRATKITLPNGVQTTPIGEVSYARRSAIEENGVLRDREFWISSWSLEFDPRLFAEFTVAGGPPCDAVIVAWDTEALANRIDAATAKQLPDWLFAGFPIQYFDPYDLQPSSALDASMEKDFSYAYQRELRLGLRPPTPIEKGQPKFLKIGPLTDIAGVYSSDGHKLRGVGPPTWAEGLHV